ncbi:T9SS type A sorting domain-containing protein [Microvirga sp. STS02]|uniref:T9SS type A sorting domain-containing protein n=1 Tax=Hymenobacter negativus TaxID=2795026 RepID=UPI0018DE6D82|nr:MULTISPECIES: T9SS type A sorting domain-containing protein [Bacteria]MBH8567475.1 T9SS type A sorting domain-containing protein [Hymenobacter negativus]MBR7207207.1 T9SS type A sorting domain-containing protein [Microvirga sp. STS02]
MHLLNADGTYNSVFAPGVPLYNYIRPDGRIYAPVINTSNNTATVVRYLATGAVDATFATVTVAMDPTQPNPVLEVKPTPAGDLLLVGTFQQVNGASRSRIAKVSATGVLNATFNPTGAWQSTTRVYNFDAWPLATGEVYVCWDDNLRSQLIRLSASGSPDNSFVIGSGPFTNPNTINNYFKIAAIQPNGQPFVTGGFTSFSGQPALSLVRLTTTGTPDPAFNAAFPVRYSPVLLQPDGRVLVQQLSGTLNAQLRRLNADGSIDTNFPAVPVPNSVHGIGGTPILQPDGKILVYGNFTRINGQPRIGLARLTNTLLATRPAFAAAPEMDVFPNPARRQIIIRLPLATASATAQPIDLLDMQGRLVRRFILPARQTEASLALEQVAAGIYLLQTNTAHGLVRQRVVVTD